MNELQPAFARVVLIRDDDRQFNVDDILAHAWFLAELQDPWSELIDGVAYEAHARDHDLAHDDETLNAMAEEFRYARDLLTVEETESWLAARDLTEDDFNEYLVRSYWRDHPPDTLPPQKSDYLSSSAELRELLRVQLLFSGRFEGLARKVSWRLADGVEPEGPDSTQDGAEDEHAHFFERTGLDETSLPDALNQLNRTQAWLEECLQMEARYRKTCAALLSDQARARTLAAMRLPLTRFKIQNLTLGSLEAAQEAVLCLTKDGLSPEQVAQECGAVWDEQELFLADLPTDVQQQFLSAAAGEVLTLISRPDRTTCPAECTASQVDRAG